MAGLGAAALLGATGMLYMLKKTFSSGAVTTPRLSVEDYQEDQTSMREITMPAIVSDIDGVVIRAKENVPGTKETLEFILSPYKDTGRILPFVFLSNGGGTFESEKARRLNEQIGLGKSKTLLGKLLG